MSNKKLSVKELEILRKKAVSAVIKEGITRTQAARLFGFSRTSITKYIRAYELEGEASLTYKKRGVSPLVHQYLSEDQTKELVETLLCKLPDELSLPYTLWKAPSS